MGLTKIEWAGKSWNPLKARLLYDVDLIKADGSIRVMPAGKVGYHCEHVSAGCKLCYAETGNKRGLPSWGTGLAYNVPNRDKVKIFIDEKVLLEPLSWKQPTKIFPCSMTDLFADFVPYEYIDRVFAIAGMCDGVTPWEHFGGRIAGAHTMQILTKRASRMREYVESRSQEWARTHFVNMPGFSIAAEWVRRGMERSQFGFSAEDQPNFDARWLEMRKLAAAGWFVWCSLEPLLGPVNCLAALMDGPDPGQCASCGHGHGFTRCPNNGGIATSRTATWDGVQCLDFKRKNFALAWAVIGGESGPGARPLNLRWVHKTIEQFAAADVPLFVKQAGAKPFLPSCADADCTHPDCDPGRLKLKDKKGGNPLEWPKWMRVREFPGERP